MVEMAKNGAQIRLLKWAMEIAQGMCSHQTSILLMANGYQLTVHHNTLERLSKEFTYTP
jgi:hypothetical protein